MLQPLLPALAASIERSLRAALAHLQAQKQEHGVAMAGLSPGTARRRAPCRQACILFQGGPVPGASAALPPETDIGKGTRHRHLRNHACPRAELGTEATSAASLLVLLARLHELAGAAGGTPPTVLQGAAAAAAALLACDYGGGSGRVPPRSAALHEICAELLARLCYAAPGSMAQLCGGDADAEGRCGASWAGWACSEAVWGGAAAGVRVACPCSCGSPVRRACTRVVDTQNTSPTTAPESPATHRLLDRWLLLCSTPDMAEAFIPSLAAAGRARRHLATVGLCALLYADASAALRDLHRAAAALSLGQSFAPAATRYAPGLRFVCLPHIVTLVRHPVCPHCRLP